MEKLFNIIRAGKYHSSSSITDERKSKYYELEIYTADGGVGLMDGHSHEKKQGRIVAAKPNMRRQSIGGFECCYVHFECLDKEFCEKYLDLLDDVTDVGDNAYYTDLFFSIAESFSSKSEAREVITDALLSLLCGRLFDLCKKASKPDVKFADYKQTIMDSKNYIAANFNKKITLENLADEAHMSPSYFHLVFKKITGKTPYDYISDIRISCAKKMIINTDFPFSQIAEKCGFTSQAYFNYSFKKATGNTPNNYRKVRRFTI